MERAGRHRAREPENIAEGSVNLLASEGNGQFHIVGAVLLGRQEIWTEERERRRGRDIVGKTHDYLLSEMRERGV